MATFTQDELDAARKLMKMFGGLLAIAGAMDRVESIEQAEGEAKMRLNQSNGALELAQHDLEEVKAAAQQVIDHANKVKAEAEAYAANQKDTANQIAEGRIELAKDRAAHIVTAAEQQVAGIQEQIDDLRQQQE